MVIIWIILFIISLRSKKFEADRYFRKSVFISMISAILYEILLQFQGSTENDFSVVFGSSRPNIPQMLFFATLAVANGIALILNFKSSRQNWLTHLTKILQLLLFFLFAISILSAHIFVWM